MKPKLLALSILLLMAICPAAHAQLRNLSVTSYEVVSYNVFTDKLTLRLTIRNDSNDFTIRSFNGLVYQNQQPLVHLSAANLVVPHYVSTIGVVCHVSRCNGVSFFRLLKCLFPFNVFDYTVNVAVAVQYPNASVEYKEQKNIALSTRVKFS